MENWGVGVLRWKMQGDADLHTKYSQHAKKEERRMENCKSQISNSRFTIPGELASAL
jgi:hypothetical protein